MMGVRDQQPVMMMMHSGNHIQSIIKHDGTLFYTLHKKQSKSYRIIMGSNVTSYQLYCPLGVWGTQIAFHD